MTNEQNILADGENLQPQKPQAVQNGEQSENENKKPLHPEKPEEVTQKIHQQKSAEGRIRKAVRQEYEAEMAELRAFKNRSEDYFSQKKEALTQKWQTQSGRSGERLLKEVENLPIATQVGILESVVGGATKLSSPLPPRTTQTTEDPYSKYRNRNS